MRAFKDVGVNLMQQSYSRR